MKCDKIREMLSAYLLNDLDDFSRRNVEAHLKECADCRAARLKLEATLEQVRDALAVTRTSSPKRLSPDRRRRVLDGNVNPIMLWLTTGHTRLAKAAAVAVVGLIVFLYVFVDRATRDMYESLGGNMPGFFGRLVAPFKMHELVMDDVPSPECIEELPAVNPVEGENALRGDGFDAKRSGGGRGGPASGNEDQGSGAPATGAKNAEGWETMVQAADTPAKVQPPPPPPPVAPSAKPEGSSKWSLRGLFMKTTPGGKGDKSDESPVADYWGESGRRSDKLKEEANDRGTSGKREPSAASEKTLWGDSKIGSGSASVSSEPAGPVQTPGSPNAFFYHADRNAIQAAPPTRQQIPLLGDVPVFGNWFTTETERKQELSQVGRDANGDEEKTEELKRNSEPGPGELRYKAAVPAVDPRPGTEDNQTVQRAPALTIAGGVLEKPGAAKTDERFSPISPGKGGGEPTALDTEHSVIYRANGQARPADQLQPTSQSGLRTLDVVAGEQRKAQLTTESKGAPAVVNGKLGEKAADGYKVNEGLRPDNDVVTLEVDDGRQQVLHQSDVQHDRTELAKLRIEEPPLDDPSTVQAQQALSARERVKPANSAGKSSLAYKHGNDKAGPTVEAVNTTSALQFSGQAAQQVVLQPPSEPANLAGAVQDSDDDGIADQEGGFAKKAGADVKDRDGRERETQTGPIFKAVGLNPFVKLVEGSEEGRFSTFSIDVDTASYTLARNYMMRGMLPPAEAVRTEDFVNFFDYGYKAPTKTTFSVDAQCAPSPFGRGLHLLKIGIKGRRIGREEQRRAVLTFLIDTSGSMSTADRLPLVQRSMRMLLEKLDPSDMVAIVAYNTRARLILEHTPAAQKERILQAVDSLQTTGSTNLEDGMRTAYGAAARAFVPGGANRVLLLSDGAANLGGMEAEGILKGVEAYRKQGVYCSVFGFGSGTYNDVMLETLANKGDGTYNFIDSDQEARRVFVEDLSATLNVIASDVKIQVEFNPKRVKQYRQLGYENRQLKREDFRNDSVDAGEVGSGQSVTALYELDLQGASAAEPVGVVRVRCRNVQTGQIEEVERPIVASDILRTFESADPRFKLAAAVAEFSEILRASDFARGSDYDDVAKVLDPAALELGLDGRVQELRRMVHAAASLPRGGGI